MWGGGQGGCERRGGIKSGGGGRGLRFDVKKKWSFCEKFHQKISGGGGGGQVGPRTLNVFKKKK